MKKSTRTAAMLGSSAIVVSMLTLMSGVCFASSSLRSASPAQRLVGDYLASDNSLFSSVQGVVRVRALSGNRLALRSTMDITGNPSCHSSIGEMVSLQTSWGAGPNTPVDATFRLNKGNCPDILGDVVTLHYNRTLTGEDNYEVELVVSSHRTRYSSAETKQSWILKRR